MKKEYFKRTNAISAFILFILGMNLFQMKAQDRTLYFDVDAAGVSKPITWGLDLAWLSEGNIRRGITFMGGASNVDVVRSSFIPSDPIVNGALTGDALVNTNLRLDIINTWLNSNTQIVLNCDHPSVDASFYGNASTWTDLLDITTTMHENTGRSVVTVSPFNEPDYTVAQGTVSHFYNICAEMRNRSRFNNIRISGGNTLNCDVALDWYNNLVYYLDEGNTHQLAGSFDNYANFYQTVRNNGDHGTNDELHNVMEAMVGVEYGMQTGIWWGTAEYARGEFCKASDGVRLAYAEHRDNWTAASVYRAPSGKVQAFVGGSERQAATTSYKFVSQNKAVYFDGYGPYYEYTMEYPGGAVGSYQNGQTNAEKVINITWGEDIQPVIDGTYTIVSRHSGKVLDVADNSTADGANIQQWTYSGGTNQQWVVSPVDSRIGGDFSYFSIIGVGSGKSLDLTNWSLDNGANIQLYSAGTGATQQWYLEYAEDGWFYIRSRQSGKPLDVYNWSTEDGGNIAQWDYAGGANQQWRFIPVGAPVEFDAPVAPSNLSGTGNVSYINLSWTASSSSDVAGYTIYRAAAGEAYNTIARNVSSTSYNDYDVQSGTQYYYKVIAVDQSLNRSSASNEIGGLETSTSSGGSSIADGHVYSFISKLSNKAIEIYNAGTDNGSLITQFDYYGTNHQKWIATQNSDGTYSFASSNSTGRSLDVPACNFTNGVQLNIWDTYGNDCQKFNMEDMGNGYYRIHTTDDSKCIDVYGASTDNSAAIALWDCHSGDNQQWALIDHGLKSGTISDPILEEDNTISIAAYPNPVETELTIAIENFEGQVLVEIYSMDGRLEKQVIDNINISGNLTVPTWGYKGLGLVKVTAGNEVKLFKLNF